MKWNTHDMGRPEGRLLPMLLAIVVLLITSVSGARQYPVKGMVVSVNRGASTFTASIEEIPGFMRAMTMPFEVRQVKELDGLAPGAMVEFTLVVEAKTSYAQGITIVRFQNVEQDHHAALRCRHLHESRQGRRCRFAPRLLVDRMNDRVHVVLVLRAVDARSTPQQVERQVVSDPEQPTFGVVDRPIRQG